MEDTITAVEERLSILQKGMGTVRGTAIALDELNISCRLLQNDLAQSQQLLQASLSENEAMRSELDEVQEYAADLKQQKTQLQKKVKLLEELNSQLQYLSDAGQR
jgi:predicted nuclease with TOPRIM domain